MVRKNMLALFIGIPLLKTADALDDLTPPEPTGPPEEGGGVIDWAANKLWSSVSPKTKKRMATDVMSETGIGEGDIATAKEGLGMYEKFKKYLPYIAGIGLPVLLMGLMMMMRQRQQPQSQMYQQGPPVY